MDENEFNLKMLEKDKEIDALKKEIETYKVEKDAVKVKIDKYEETIKANTDKINHLNGIIADHISFEDKTDKEKGTKDFNTLYKEMLDNMNKEQ